MVGVNAKQLDIPLMRGTEMLGVRITPIEGAVVVVAVVTMVAIHLLLSRTILGKTMRATSGNRDLAEIAGVDTDSVVRKTWFVSAAAGALAGILYAVLFAPFRPTVGFNYLIVVFAATLLGGIGRPYGAMLGAFVVGLTTQLGTAYVSADYSAAYAFLILVLVLLLKPDGIRGGEI
jgi:branched-subunit amino acid ABC-type transport system permease component